MTTLYATLIERQFLTIKGSGLGSGVIRQLVLENVGNLSVRTANSRVLSPKQVRIRPIAVGICGSDIHGYAGKNNRRVPGQVMGHEFCGEIVEVGEEARVSVGEFAAVNPVVVCGLCSRCEEGKENLCTRRLIIGCVPELPGAFADEVIVPEKNVVIMQRNIPLEWGALVEPFAVGAHAISLAGLSTGASIAVLGGGPIGLGAALAAGRHRPRQLLVSEPDPSRRALIESLGLITVPPNNFALGEEEFDVVIDCVGHTSTIRQALGLARAGGTVVVPGLSNLTADIRMDSLVMAERTLKGSAVYLASEFCETAQWVGSGDVDLSPVIEERVPLSALPSVFKGYAEGSRNTYKTVFVAE